MDKRTIDQVLEMLHAMQASNEVLAARQYAQEVLLQHLVANFVGQASPADEVQRTFEELEQSVLDTFCDQSPTKVRSFESEMSKRASEHASVIMWTIAKSLGVRRPG